LWCNVGFAELINFNKCFQKNETFKDNKFKDVGYFQDEHTWSVNLSSSKITNIIKYKKDFKDKYGYKDEYWDFDLHNFTDNLIVARTYAYNTADNTWLENQNDRSVISYEVSIDVKNKEVTIKRFPNGTIGLSLKTIGYIAKLKNITFNEAIDEHVGYYHDIYICEEVEGLGDKESGKTDASSGTAFFINNKGNLITNNHVVEGCGVSKINYFKKEYKTNLISTDKTLDLALLKVDLKPKAFISFSNKEPRKRQLVIIAGYPLGKDLSDDLKINEGKISSLKGFENNSNEITVDLAINPGNSGGPIVNENGQLVAVAVAGMSKDVTEGISFGIKSSAVTNFLKINKISPDIKLTSFSMNDEKVNQLLEESTVYIFCE